MRQILAGQREATVWLVLVLATVLSWVLGSHARSGPATIGVLVVTFVKVWLIGRNFMEIRSAPPALRVALDIYVVLVCAALGMIYALG